MFPSKRFILDETFTKLEDSRQWLEKSDHLFVIDASSFVEPSPLKGTLNQIVNHHDRETAGWISDNKLLLVGSGPGVGISELR